MVNQPVGAGKEASQKGPEVGEDLADVVAAAAENGEESITDRALEGAAGEAAVGLHVADLGLDGAATPEQPGQSRREPAPHAADKHLRALDAMAAVSTIDHGEAGTGSGQGFDLLEGVGEGVTVIGVAGHGAHADDEAAGQGGGDADLGAELVADPGFALGDAVHRRFVQGVELSLAFGCLPQQAGDEGGALLDPRPQPTFGDGAEMAADIAQDTPRVALQGAQRLAHAAELPGVGVPPCLDGQTWRQTVVVLSQGDPGLLRQRHQGAACLLVEAAVGRVSDGLLHHRRVHRDLEQAARRHSP